MTAALNMKARLSTHTCHLSEPLGEDVEWADGFAMVEPSGYAASIGVQVAISSLLSTKSGLQGAQA